MTNTKDKRVPMTSIESHDNLKEKDVIAARLFEQICLLGEKGVTRAESVKLLDIADGTIGPRFRDLEGMGLIKRKREGSEIVRRLNPDVTTKRSWNQVWIPTGRSWADRTKKDPEPRKDRLGIANKEIENLKAETERLRLLVQELQKKLQAFEVEATRANDQIKLPGI